MNYAMNNPMLDYQRRNLMAQQQMIQAQLNQLNSAPTFNPHPQPQADPFFVKQVGSIDEAKGYPVDPAVIYLFPDTGTGKIYLKRLNTDNGKSELIIYAPTEGEKTPVEAQPTLEGIASRLESIEGKIGGIYESIFNASESRPVGGKSAGSRTTANAGKNESVKPTEVPAG